MEALPKLQAQLHEARKASRRVSSATRKLQGETAQDRLGAILQEIGETFLPRQLVFVLGDSRLVVEAGDRKLRAVAEVTPAEFAEADIAVPPSASRDNQRIAAFAVLSRFAEVEGEVTVTPQPPEHFKTMGVDGLTLEEILAAEGKTAAPSTPSPETDEPNEVRAAQSTFIPHPSAPPPETNTPAGAFYAATAGATARAVTADDGGIADKSGNDQLVPLEYLLRTFGSQIKMNTPFTDAAMPGPKAIYMGSQAEGMPSVVCFEDGKNLAVTIPDESSIDQTLDIAAKVLANMTPES